MLATDKYTIDANFVKPIAENYDALRAAGVEHVQKLSGNIWTDDNIHDPGITILELLCYAICDLGYRTSFDMNDLLTEPGKKAPTRDDSFFTAKDILTSAPITLTDYRKLLLDAMPVLQNAWIQTNDGVDYSPSIYYDYVTKKNSFSPPSDDHPSEKLQLRGLYSVKLELEDYHVAVAFHGEFLNKLISSLPLNPPSTPPTTDGGIVAQEYYGLACLNYACGLLKQWRNLCEDFDRIKVLMEEKVAICADIVLKPGGDYQYVWKEIYRRVNNFISPRIPTYTFDTMLKNGKRIDEIFQATVATRGFINMDELERFDHKTVIYAGEITKVIMAIDGVQAVRNLSLSSYHETAPGEWTLYANTQKYCIKLSDPLNYSFRLALDFNDPDSTNWFNHIKFIKGLVFFIPKHGSLNIADVLDIPGIPDGFADDLPYPTGTYRETNEYVSIQNEFPKNYMLGPDRVPDSTPTLRRAQRLQLKGYLVFFEQLLADYLAQLTNLNRLLSWRQADDADTDVEEDLLTADTDNLINRTVDRTYYYQVLREIDGQIEGIKEISDIESLITNYTTPLGSPPIDYATVIDNDSVFDDRKNRLLDYLLAQFNEKFVDYSLFKFTQTIDNSNSYFTDHPSEDIIYHKMEFLEKYPIISGWRSKAMNYAADALASWNVSGLEYRVMKIAGIENILDNGVPSFRRLVDVIRDSTSDHNPVFDGGKYQVIDNRLEPFVKVFGLHVLEHILLRPQFPWTYTEVLYNYQSLSYKNPLLDPDFISYLDGSLHGEEFIPSPPTGAPGPESQDFIDNIYKVILENALFYANDTSHSDVPPATMRRLIATAFYDLVASARNKVALTPFNRMSGASVRNWTAINNQLKGVTTEHGKLQEDITKEKILFFNDPDQVRDDCFCIDPYSMKIQVMLPGWLPIAEDQYFRAFMEQTIRMEAPAHVGVRICWLNPAQMYQFEEAYLQFMTAMQECNACITKFTGVNWVSALAKYFAALAHLQYIISGLKNTYAPSSLDGCEFESAPPPASPPYPGFSRRPVILDQTAITGGPDEHYEFVQLWEVVLYPASNVIILPTTPDDPHSLLYELKASKGFFTADGLATYATTVSVNCQSIEKILTDAADILAGTQDLPSRSFSFHIPLSGTKTLVWCNTYIDLFAAGLAYREYLPGVSPFRRATSVPLLVFDSANKTLLATLQPTLSIEMIDYSLTTVTIRLTRRHPKTTVNDIGPCDVEMNWVEDAHFVTGAAVPGDPDSKDLTLAVNSYYVLGAQANYTSIYSSMNKVSSGFSMVIKITAPVTAPADTGFIFLLRPDLEAVIPAATPPASSCYVDFKAGPAFVNAAPLLYGWQSGATDLYYATPPAAVSQPAMWTSDHGGENLKWLSYEIPYTGVDTVILPRIITAPPLPKSLTFNDLLGNAANFSSVVCLAGAPAAVTAHLRPRFITERTAGFTSPTSVRLDLSIIPDTTPAGILASLGVPSWFIDDLPAGAGSSITTIELPKGIHKITARRDYTLLTAPFTGTAECTEVIDVSSLRGLTVVLQPKLKITDLVIGGGSAFSFNLRADDGFRALNYLDESVALPPSGSNYPLLFTDFSNSALATTINETSSSPTQQDFSVSYNFPPSAGVIAWSHLPVPLATDQSVISAVLTLSVQDADTIPNNAFAAPLMIFDNTATPLTGTAYIADISVTVVSATGTKCTVRIARSHPPVLPLPSGTTATIEMFWTGELIVAPHTQDPDDPNVIYVTFPKGRYKIGVLTNYTMNGIVSIFHDTPQSASSMVIDIV